VRHTEIVLNVKASLPNPVVFVFSESLPQILERAEEEIGQRQPAEAAIEAEIAWSQEKVVERVPQTAAAAVCGSCLDPWKEPRTSRLEVLASGFCRITWPFDNTEVAHTFQTPERMRHLRGLYPGEFAARGEIFCRSCANVLRAWRRSYSSNEPLLPLMACRKVRQ
jgi:hypothetical protein